MFYSEEMVNNLGYKNTLEFAQDYAKQYSNCCILWRQNGVYVYTDFYTTIIGNNGEIIKRKYYK